MTTETARQILFRYLEHFLPASAQDQNVVLKSSQDIADDLADIVEIDINSIAEEMAPVYTIRFDGDGLPKWAMIPND